LCDFELGITICEVVYVISVSINNQLSDMQH